MLEGLKVLDFSTLLPGPFASWRMAELGCDVKRIVAPGKRDLVLDMGHDVGDGVSAIDGWLNNSKDSMELNLKDPNSVDLVKDLILNQGYDIILEQFRPGVMDKFGLGYEDIKKIKEDIIYISITGFGQSGPLKDKASHDLSIMALSGLASYSGTDLSGPPLLGIEAADMLAAHNAVIGMLSAVYNRQVTGKGCHVDVAMLDSLIPLNTMAGINSMARKEAEKRQASWLLGDSIYDYYKTSDGGYMCLAALEPKFWEKFSETIGKPEWAEAGAFASDYATKKEEIKEIFSSKTRDEWIEIFKDSDCCVEPVLDTKEILLENDNIRQRNLVKEVSFKNKKIMTYGEPIKFIK